MARENGKTKRGGRRGRGACRGISPIPVATSVNRVYRIPDRPINWLTDPPCIMQPRRAELFFSRCSRASEPELFRAHAHTHTPSTTCGYERVTLRILLSGCSRSLHRLLTFSPTPASINRPIAMHRLRRGPSLYRVAHEFSYNPPVVFFLDERKTGKNRFEKVFRRFVRCKFTVAED